MSETPKDTPAPKTTHKDAFVSAEPVVVGESVPPNTSQGNGQNGSKWVSRKLLVLIGCFAACFGNAFLENPIDPEVLNTLLYTTIGYLVSQGYVDAKGLDKGMLGALGGFAANSGQSAGKAHRGEDYRTTSAPMPK